MDWNIVDKIKNLEFDLSSIKGVLTRLKSPKGFDLSDYEDIECYIGEEKFKTLIHKELENVLKTKTQEIEKLKIQLVKELQE